MSTLTAHPTTRVMPAARPAARPTPRSTVRLTRRGRVVVVVMALLVVLLAGMFISAGSVATEQPEATEIVLVGEGETLWDLAAAVADDGEVQSMINHIKDLNDLESGMLVAGQQLRVPAS